MSNTISLNLRIWRQDYQSSVGKFEQYRMTALSVDISLLEALDKLNEKLITQGERPINFDHDCREGICGSCGFLVNGQAHGFQNATTICQLYLRQFQDETTLTLEPWRSKPFKIIQDLVVDRSPLDDLIAAGGYCNVSTGDAPDANALLISQNHSISAFQTATCIGCGACIAACPNGSASLFVAAKLAHLGQLPQGQLDRVDRARNMQEKMFEQGFGSCSNHLECEAVCPKAISANWISWMNGET